MEKMKVMVVAAHPDEADMYAGGTAALFAESGADVKFLSITCGDAGHYQIGGMQLAQRRHEEAQKAAKCLGIKEYEVLNEHDGELYPSLAVRNQVIERIRRWAPDVLIGFHPDGWGHPDNRNAGKAVADAVAFVGVPNVLPNIPAIMKPILCLWMWDFSTIQIHQHDIAIDVTPAIEKKLLACDAHATQFYEFAPWSRGFLNEVPNGWAEKKQFLLKYWPEFMYTQGCQVEGLACYYGSDKAKRIQFAETFQIAPYGFQPSAEDIERYFPMLPGPRKQHSLQS
jgi:LmbE family N-acetylglucosaminyl deacetylase